MCAQRHEHCIEAKGQDSCFAAAFTGNSGKAGVKVMTYKITVAFECKNLKITNVAAMTEMLLVLKFVFLVWLSHPNIKFKVSIAS